MLVPQPVARWAIPQALQWARSTLDTYEVGEVEFDTMINAQMRVLQFELQADRMLFSIYQKRAQLEEIIGGPVSDAILTKTDYEK